MGKKLSEKNKLINVYPQIANEWHPTKNGKLTPSDISYGSEKYVWWKCPKGPDHEWEMMVLTRKKGGRCPFCINRKVSVTNNLKTLYPDIAQDWDYESNKGLKPENILAGTNQKVHWKCQKCKAKWSTKVAKRTKEGSGCPSCSRKVDDKEEALVNKYPSLMKEWDYKKNKKIDPTHYHYRSAKKVYWKCADCSFEWEAMIKSRTVHKDSGCPKCHSIFTLYPELTSEWSFEKNSDISIFETVPGSEKKVWWTCPIGHGEYQTTPYLRTKMRTGCPKCGVKKGVENRINNLINKIGRETCQENELNNLEDKFPELAKEWHPTKNEGLLPHKVTSKSNKNVWWACSYCRHEWRTTVASRSAGRNCPECAKKSRIESYKKYKLNSGSSLSEKFPELVKEWNYEKNREITPEDVNYGSNEEYWWECELGHEWKSSVKSRTSKGTGCKYCNYELKTSFPEQAIYFYLNKVFKDVINSYQIKILDKNVEVDIFIPSLNIAIEYDGVFYHAKRIKQDNQKNKNLNSVGIKVVRIREEGLDQLEKFNGITLTSNVKNNENINNIMNSVFYYIANSEKISNEELNKIKNVKIDIEEDEIEINSLFVISLKKNSLATNFPEIAKEWHTTKNGKLKPSSVKSGSAKKVWWLCTKCGDEWKAPIYTRTMGVHNCKWCDKNNLIKKKPELLKEWDFQKNKDIDFLRISFSSGKYVWWKCKNGHEWQSTIANRKNGNGCPYCSGKKASYENCLATLKPNIAKYWHPNKNGKLTPYDVTVHSSTEVWWYCDKGKAHKHEWKSTVSNKKTENCPFCSGHKVGLDNCLATSFPQLSQEWDYEKNKDLTPFTVTAYSNKKVWWKNKEKGTWEQKIYSRVKAFKN